MFKQDILERELNNLGIDDKDVFLKLIRFRALILEWNEKINLTTITDEEEMYIKHFIDSYLILENNFIFKNKKVLDLGTGAGFPGIPLSILLKDTEFCLLDAVNKKINFLEIVIKDLNLKNVNLIHGRAEDYAKQDDFRQKFDFVISRAVADLPVLLEYSLPFVKIGGYLIAYKGKNYTSEIDRSANALDLLGGEIKNTFHYNLPLIFDDRYFIIIEKVKDTPFRYPRKAGKATTNPL
ncbi:MAG: 16S rRNA (guanine(527)-N(7))-methyltransferase RsmG [Clostridiales bacterium]|nr:16S rRNA (guanine(527)-N(7))-methyltransferase RsmG [Clostridiales bacterium]